MTTRKADFNQTKIKIQNLLTQSEKPLILSHIRPDGDAIGSVIALSLALQKIGKKPQGVITDGIPRKYKSLIGADQISTHIKGDYDLVIALDCADKKRVGSSAETSNIHINIDHHVTNELFGDTNLVIPEQPATAAILAEYLPCWGFAIDLDIANALLMGIITDTIGFRTSNVTPETMCLTAELMKKGADLTGLYHHFLTVQSLAASMIWGKALSRLKSEGNLAWTSITLEDRAIAKYQGRDDADLTNYLSSLEKIDVAILFNEQNDGTVKISWRSNAKFDVSKIAVLFNGGGHPPAAGADITGSFETVTKQVLAETKKFMKGKK